MSRLAWRSGFLAALVVVLAGSRARADVAPEAAPDHRGAARSAATMFAATRFAATMFADPGLGAAAAIDHAFAHAFAPDRQGARALGLDLPALRRRIGEVLAKRRAPGAAVTIVKQEAGGVGLSYHLGFGEASPGAAMDDRTLFRVGSFTKSFIALAVMRLVEKGKLRLTDRVQDLVPRGTVRNPWERTHPLRVEHLLEHTSGFDEMRFNEIFDRQVGEDRPLAEVLARNPNSRVARWPPGTRFAYSQPGYTVAGAIIERVSGMRYEDFLREEVFRPLGIEGAGLRLRDVDRARVATGHDRGRQSDYLTLLHRPALNLLISARDMGRLLRMLIGRGQIDGRQFLSPASVARIERTGTLPYGPPNVRYGLGNWGDVSQPIPMRGHGGMIPGYHGIYRYAPQLGFGFVVLVNDSARWDASDRIGRAILEQLMDEVHVPAPPRQPAPPGLARSFAAHYRHAAPSIEFLRWRSDVYDSIDLEETDGELFLRHPKHGRTLLIHTTHGHFRFRGDSDSSIELLRDSAGRRVAVIGSRYYEEESALFAWARRFALELSLFILVTAAVGPVLALLHGSLATARSMSGPVLAALFLWAMAGAFQHGRSDGDLGARNLTTGFIWLASWGFALATRSSFVRAVQMLRKPEVPLGFRVHLAVTSSAAVWLLLHLLRYGLIGLKTWRW